MYQYVARSLEEGILLCLEAVKEKLEEKKSLSKNMRVVWRVVKSSALCLSLLLQMPGPSQVIKDIICFCGIK